MPDVSVIVPAHNDGRTIEAALSSALSQTVGDVEVIVVDDGSTDDTAARVRKQGPRVSLMQQPRAGRANAFLAGLTSARADLIAFMDPASIWMPRKLERQLRYLRTYRRAALVHGAVINSPVPTTHLLESNDVVPVDRVLAPPRLEQDPGTVASAIVATTVVVRRQALQDAGLHDVLPEDTDALRGLWTRVLERNEAGCIDVPTALVRPLEPRSVPTVAERTRRLNLIHDTVLRRTRTRVTDLAHRVDALVSRRSSAPMRVLFEAASPMSLAVFAPVLRRLLDDARLQFWFTSCDRSWSPQTIFESVPFAQRVVTPDEVRWAKFDAYINTDFWDMTWLPRRAKRMHFFHGVAGKYGLDAPVKIAPVVATFDRLMFPNRDRLRRYAQAGLIDGDGPEAALIGYPKVDCLVDGSLNRRDTLSRVRVDPGRPTVLYAPTWSPYSSLNSVGHQVIQQLGALDVNVIVKLHDRSYDATTRGSGGVDWRSQLRHVCERHGARLVQDADASPWLHAADLLITDHSSVGFEFMLLDRPIVVLDSPDLIAHARVNPEKVTMLRGAASVVTRIGDLAAVVRDALASPREQSAARMAVADELFYCPGSATARAVHCLYDLLQLSLPATVPLVSTEPRIGQMASLARGM